MAAKLVSEFVEPLGRVTFGAELRVSRRFKKPDALVGPYFIVAVEGAQFPSSCCSRDSELVAVDLSSSGLRELRDQVFEYCGRLAAVACPGELVRIGAWCFWGCTALAAIDLVSTGVEEFGFSVFSGSGLARVSLPASLRKLDLSAFEDTPLASLDLSASAGVAVVEDDNGSLQVMELVLPREGFVALAEALLPGSRIEVLYADVDAVDIEPLLSQLDGWAIERLRVVSPRLGEPFEWVGRAPSPGVTVFDPETLTAPSAVTLTVWRMFPDDQLDFVRSMDLSAVDELPKWGSLSGSFFIESVILPTRLRALPGDFARGCARLSHVGTAGCRALEKIGCDAFRCCRSLREFVFPSMVREVDSAFTGTSIVSVDLSGTQARSMSVVGMGLLESLRLPRCCILKVAFGLPALRSVTFGACDDFWCTSPREVRFESLASPAQGGSLAVGTCAFAEVACVSGRESFPFPP
jgi:hypothetical protein